MSIRNSAPREADSLRPVASRNEGFTLIETVIAMVVMMVVGLGATSLFLYSIRSNVGGNDRSQAQAIAQQRIEELRSLPFNHAQLAIGETNTIVVHQNIVSSASTGTAPTSGVTATSSTSSGTSSGTSSSGGGSDSDATDDDTYRVLLNVEGLPGGTATPTQKRITIRVTPENIYGANSWINSNPVTIVIHRSSPVSGPYRL